MSKYTLVNCIAMALAVLTLIMLRDWRRVVRVLKIAILGPLLSFPWLYFGISQGSWSHGDPGPLFMKVPLNELALAFLMTVVNGGVLVLNHRAIKREVKGVAKRGTS